MELKEICSDCVIQKRAGSLPCKYRTEIDLLTLAADSPQVVIVSCPHHEASEEKRYQVSVIVYAESQDKAVEMAKRYVNSGNVLIKEV